MASEKQPCPQQSLKKRETLSFVLLCVQERSLPCQGYACHSGSSTVGLQQVFCEALEVSHEHQGSSAYETATAEAARFCVSANPAVSISDVNGPGRNHCLLCNLHVVHAHSAGKGGRARWLWCVRRTCWSGRGRSRSLCWLLVEETLLTPALSLCLRSSQGSKTHPCSLR